MKRAEFSKHEILPTKHSFPKLVRIMSMVAGFVSKCRKGRKILNGLMREEKLWFGVFTARIQEQELYTPPAQARAQILQVRTDDPSQGQAEQHTSLLSYFTNSPLEEDVVTKFRSTQNVLSTSNGTMAYIPTDQYINMALLYLYRKNSTGSKRIREKEQVGQSCS